MHLDPKAAERAAEILRRGGIVVVPTETVYGLAGDALNPSAVRRIFDVKGRPSDNPLICHIASTNQLAGLVSSWPEHAKALADKFWPGPLSLVLPKAYGVPAETTAHLDTVAVRMPAHPLFREVIERSGRPLAAPSANPYMSLSPTSVDQLDADLIDSVDMVVNGGPCSVGIESAVVDLSRSVPRLLRPGVIDRLAIEAVLGRALADPDDSVRRSPGMNPRHYAPHTRLKLVKNAGTSPALVFGRKAGRHQINMPTTPNEYAADLYRSLHHLDSLGLESILVEEPPRTAAWAAVWDRLARAATP